MLNHSERDRFTAPLWICVWCPNRRKIWLNYSRGLLCQSWPHQSNRMSGRRPGGQVNVWCESVSTRHREAALKLTKASSNPWRGFLLWYGDVLGHPSQTVIYTQTDLTGSICSVCFLYSGSEGLKETHSVLNLWWCVRVVSVAVFLLVLHWPMWYFKAFCHKSVDIALTINTLFKDFFL